MRTPSVGRTGGIVVICAGALLVAACDGTRIYTEPTPSPDTLPAAAIVQRAAVALVEASSFTVNYHWQGDSTSIDNQYFVTPTASGVAASKSACVRLANFVDLLDYTSSEATTSLQRVGTRRVVFLDVAGSWRLQVLDAYPPYPLELSRLEGNGRGTYKFSGFDGQPNPGSIPTACAPIPTPAPANGTIDINLSGAAAGRLIGAVQCSRVELATTYPKGLVTINGHPQPHIGVVSVVIQLDSDPPYPATVSFLAGASSGRVTASRVVGPNLHAQFYGPLYGPAGVIELSADITCDGLPAAAVTASS